MDTADGGAGVLVSGGGNGTRIQDYDICFPGRLGL